jgi:hypothetical protein
VATLYDVLERWRSRCETYRTDGALVSGEKIATQVVADLEEALRTEAARELVGLADAGRLCGYSPDTIRRKIDAGELRDYGSAHRPRVRISELPRKAGSLLTQPKGAKLENSKQGIARAVIQAP